MDRGVYIVLRGIGCSTCERELRAIARYGSTVGINEVTDDGQKMTVDDRRLEGLGILDFWGIYSINN